MYYQWGKQLANQVEAIKWIFMMAACSRQSWSSLARSSGEWDEKSIRHTVAGNVSVDPRSYPTDAVWNLVSTSTFRSSCRWHGSLTPPPSVHDEADSWRLPSFRTNLFLPRTILSNEDSRLWCTTLHVNPHIALCLQCQMMLDFISFVRYGLMSIIRKSTNYLVHFWLICCAALLLQMIFIVDRPGGMLSILILNMTNTIHVHMGRDGLLASQ